MSSNFQGTFFDLKVRGRGSQPSIFVRSLRSFTKLVGNKKQAISTFPVNQIKRVRLVRWADGYYVQFCVKTERRIRNLVKNRHLSRIHSRCPASRLDEPRTPCPSRPDSYPHLFWTACSADRDCRGCK